MLKIGEIKYLFSQSVSLTQYVVLSVSVSACLPVHPFQLASESSHNVVARRRSDYCLRGAIFKGVFAILRATQFLWFHGLGIEKSQEAYKEAW